MTHKKYKKGDEYRIIENPEHKSKHRHYDCLEHKGKGEWVEISNDCNLEFHLGGCIGDTSTQKLHIDHPNQGGPHENGAKRIAILPFNFMEGRGLNRIKEGYRIVYIDRGERDHGKPYTYIEILQWQGEEPECCCCCGCCCGGHQQ